MSDKYDADHYENFPHSLMQCPDCGELVIAVGYEVETTICYTCRVPMKWKNSLHDPRSP